MNMLYPADSVALSVIEQAAMVGNPRWMFDDRSVFIGPYHSADERESHLGVTVGSMEWLWSDTEEYRFDQQSLALVSAFLVLKDATLDMPELLDPWFQAPVKVGVPKLVEALPLAYLSDISTCQGKLPRYINLSCITHIPQ